MSVYTSITKSALETFLTQYSIGSLSTYEGISAGIENTNYFVSTTQGEYVLTIYEQLAPKEIIACLGYIEMLGDTNSIVPVPLLVKKDNVRYSLYKDKYCTLTPRVKGANPEAPFSTEQLSALGQAVGHLHQTAITFYEQSSNQLSIQQHIKNGRQWREKMAELLTPLLGQTEQQWLADEMKACQAINTEHLPKGLVHSDLFPDNTLYESQHLSGIIDWNNITYDYLLYDIAIIANAWCADHTGQLKTDLTQAFLQAYHQQRPLTDNEKQAWPAMSRLAALRFWLSRTYDVKFPRKGELTQTKNPDEYKTIIQQRTLTPLLPWI